MIDSQLAEYITKQRSAGATDEQLVTKLREVGWPEEKIQEALHADLSTVPLSPKTGLSSVSELFSKSYELLQQHFVTLFGITVIGQLVPLLLVFISYLVIGGIADPLSDDLFSTGTLAILPISLGISLIGVVIQSVSYLALFIALKNLPNVPTIQEAYSQAFALLLKYWWVMFLVGLVTLGGVALFLIPAIIFSVWLMNVVYLFVEAPATPAYDLMKKSRLLTKGLWWDIVRRLAVFFIIFLVVVMVVSGILAAIGVNPSNNVVLSLTGDGILTVINAALITFGAIFNFYIYKELVRINGHLDPAHESATLFKVFTAIGLLAILVIPIFIMGVVFYIISNLQL